MDEAPPPYHAHDLGLIPIPAADAVYAPPPEDIINNQSPVLQNTSPQSQFSGIRNYSAQEVEQSGFFSATQYFEFHPPTHPQPNNFFVHTIVVGPETRLETITSTLPNSLFQLRHVDIRDWTTFANHLFPPTHREGSARSSQRTRLSHSMRTQQYSPNTSENEKSRPEELPELVNRLSLPPNKRNPSGSTPAVDASRLRRIRIESAVSEWNSRFFQPLGLKVILIFPEDSFLPARLPSNAQEDPFSQQEAEDSPLHKAVSRGKESEVRLVLNGYSQNIDARNKKGETALYCAVSRGDKSIVKILLENNADPEARPPGANSPLQLAVLHNRSSILTMLLEKSTVGLEEVTSAEETPLYLAVVRSQTKNAEALVEAGANLLARPTGKDTMLDLVINRHDSSMIKLLLENGVDPNQRNRDGDAPLHRFIATGNTSMVKTLLEYGANIKAKNGKGETPLSIAVNHSHSSIVTLLLAREDVDVNSENLKGETPLYTAVSRDNTSIAEQLLGRGADTNKRPPKGETLLNLAVSHGNSTLVNQLLDCGADVNIANKSGDSPLAQAVSRGENFVVSLLMSAGADVNAVNAAGDAIVFRAISHGNSAIASLLLTFGAKANGENHKGETALYRAVYRSDSSIAALLLCYGANPDSTSPAGETCLYRAVYIANTGLVSLLLAHGAKPDHANSNGETPLYRAVYRGDVSIVMMLIGKGASPHTPSTNAESPLQYAIRKKNKSMIQILTKVLGQGSDRKGSW